MSEQRLDTYIAANVARLLNAKKILNFLFGWLPVTLMGGDSYIHEIEFVVPDSSVKSAIDTLVNAGYKRCEDPDCRELKSYRYRGREDGHWRLYNQHHIVAEAHFRLHFEPFYPGLAPDPSEKDIVGPLIALHGQSSILPPWFPEIKPGLPADDDPHFTTTADLRLPPRAELGAGSLPGPTGPWLHLLPIQILNPSSFIENLLWLSCRDYKRPVPPAVQGLFDVWHSMLHYLSQIKLEKPLSEKFQIAWEMHLNPGKPGSPHFMVPLLKLREEMKEDGRLPKDLPKVDASGYAGAENFKW